MANQKLHSICAVNVRVHPHPQGAYVRLFKEAMELKRSVSVHGMTHVFMTLLKSDEIAGRNVLFGHLSKYTKINFEKKWFNEMTMQVAEDSDLVAVNIPTHLQPNLNEFRFAFFPEKHVIFVETEVDGEKLSPLLVEKYFSNLFSADAIVKFFGKVEVTILPDSTAVGEMFNIPVVRKVEMSLRRPNPDDFDDIEDDEVENYDNFILNKMNEQNLAEISVTYVAQQGESVAMDRESKLRAVAASRNGEVKVFGKGYDGKRIEMSSKDRPLIERGYYSDREYTGYGFFVDLIFKMLPKVLLR